MKAGRSQHSRRPERPPGHLGAFQQHASDVPSGVGASLSPGPVTRGDVRRKEHGKRPCPRSCRRRSAGADSEWSRSTRRPARRKSASDGGAPRTRARVPSLFHAAWRRSVRRGRMGDPLGRDRQREGQGRLRAARRRDPEVLVAAGDQHRRLEVLPRPDRDAGARAQRQAADRPRRRHDHAVGARSRTTSPATTRCSRSATS